MSKNLVYFCPKVNVPIGGVKVIHRHSEIVNQLGHRSEIFYYGGSAQRVDWFSHNCRIKTGSSFSRDDVAVLPESQVFYVWKELLSAGVAYGIFVQSGYLVNPGLPWTDLVECYKHAEFILCISEDAVRCVTKFFPEAACKIIRVIYSVDTNLFRPREKENIISFMPRKMKEHSDLLLPILQQHLPANWSTMAIDNLSEEQVADALGKSRIFLAFSSFEGLPVPPVEAALSGNFVIGYTGQGGREYWNGPTFEAVESGDIVGLLDRLIAKVGEIDRYGSSINSDSLMLLRHYFSSSTEEAFIAAMLEKIGL